MTGDAAIGAATIARLNRRIIPLFLVAYVINFLDRVNVGFASLQMNERLGFGPEVYGLGAGIFFIGYFLFEVPSNLVLARVGPRYWLARIMISWGLVSAATALVTTAAGFYLVRFLLGVAEAGFVPALLVYINSWYPTEYRAGAVATIWSATAIALVIGGPLSGLLLGLDGVVGLDGWQWMFVLEAVPAVLLGVVLLFILDDRPQDAHWLSEAQRRWLIDRLDAEQRDRRANGARESVGAAFAEPRVWILGLLYLCLGIGFFGITFWLPQLVKQAGDLSDLQASLLSSVPFICATGAMILAGRWSDRSGLRRRPIVAGCLLAATGFALGGQLADPLLALAALSLGAMGLWSVVGIFWQLPGAMLGGAAAAVGVAVINSCGSLGGFVGPYLIGIARARGTDFGPALLLIAGALLLGAAITAGLGRLGFSRPVPRTT